MGISYNMSSEVHPLGTETTVSEQLYEILDQPLMTIDLRTHANGTYTFGSIPTPDNGEKGTEKEGKERNPYKGEINYYPLSQSEYWQTSYTSFAIANSTYQSEWMNAGLGLEDSGPLNDTGPSPTSTSSTHPTTSTSTTTNPNAATTTPTLQEAIIDTGTSVLLLPETIVSKYYAHVPGAVFRSMYNIWTYPCDLKGPVHTRSGPPPSADAAGSAGSAAVDGNENKEPKPVLPDLKIAFGEKGGWHATIPGALFNFSVISIVDDSFRAAAATSSAASSSRPATLHLHNDNDKATKEKAKIENDPGMITQCMGGIQNNMGLDVGILGDTFLKAVFVVLDMRGRVGFADKDL